MTSRGDAAEDEEVLQEEAEYAKESEQKRVNGGDMMDPKEIEQMHQQWVQIARMTVRKTASGVYTAVVASEGEVPPGEHSH